MRIDEENKRVYVRQSWLGDALLCMERGRRMMVSPEFRVTNDSAMLGTATHAGIEAVLRNSVASKDAHHVSVAKLNELQLNEDIRVTNVDPSTWEPLVTSMTKAWVDSILPEVPLGGSVEQKFEVGTGRTVSGYELWFEGTMDYVHETGVWDWKTAARKYSPLEKQTQNIQSAIYAGAAQRLGLTPNSNDKFMFGIMIRSLKGDTQILSVQRSQPHWDWVVEQACTMIGVYLALRDGTEFTTPMPKNDQHFLCSDRWCPWWSVCKGVHIQSKDNQLGDN